MIQKIVACYKMMIACVCVTITVSVEITRQDDDSMTMRLSNSQDDDSMVSSSIEMHGISRGVCLGVRRVLKGGCAR
jgi:hypothetical protein